MPVTVTMPQMGESVVEGTIERWFVREGEAVEKDQILCEVSTDKVDAEIPAPESGVVTQLLVAEVGVAMNLEATVRELGGTCHAHPTLSEAIMEAALAAEGRSINF